MYIITSGSLQYYLFSNYEHDIDVMKENIQALYIVTAW